MISQSKAFLFVHVPKTGGNSIQSILKAWSEDEILRRDPHQDGVERFEVRNATFGFLKQPLGCGKVARLVQGVRECCANRLHPEFAAVSVGQIHGRPSGGKRFLDVAECQVEFAEISIANACILPVIQTCPGFGACARRFDRVGQSPPGTESETSCVN